MSNRLPENEAEFRLVDPIVEEYRLTLEAYKQMFVGVLCGEWAATEPTEFNLADWLSKRIGQAMLSSAAVGCFDGGMSGEIPVVPVEILDAICAEWHLPPFEELARQYQDNEDPILPDVYKEAFE